MPSIESQLDKWELLRVVHDVKTVSYKVLNVCLNDNYLVGKALLPPTNKLSG